MTTQPDSSADLEFARRLSESLFSLVESAAALISTGGSIVASNAAWAKLVGGNSSVLDECLHEFSGVETLAYEKQAGTAMLLGPQELPTRSDSPRRKYVARWRQVEAPSVGQRFVVVVLDAAGAKLESYATVIDAQRLSIKNLLIRQTMIEEKERRRLGCVLHDGIAQELALIRGQLKNLKQSDDQSARVIRALDLVINKVRDLTFELSPPVLEDLGVRSAIHWLGDHLSKRFGRTISVADDGKDPRLSPEVRTIVFRAVRELTINAVKHAGDAEIIISCITGPRTARFVVRDTGTGIDPSVAQRHADGTGRFGLVSVEQQIRGVGGSFEIISGVGEGTRVIITAPLEPEEGAAHG